MDPLPTFNLDLGIFAYSVGNINISKSLQKSSRQFASRRKRYPGYTSILIHLLIDRKILT